MTKCNCTYNTLVKRGFRPLDHAWSCPLNKDYVEPKLERVDDRNTEISPFVEVWIDEEDSKKYLINKEKITKGLRNARKNKAKKM